MHAMTSHVFSTLGLQPSFGFGDRIGVATPGHIEAMKQAGAGLAPIFAQQSIREMKRTGRTPQQVVDSAVEGMRNGNWIAASGADADHLKTCEDVDVTAAVGFTFYTIDPSDHVDGNADDYDESMLARAIRSDPLGNRLVRDISQSPSVSSKWPVIHHRRAGRDALCREIRPCDRARDHARKIHSR